MGVLTVVGVQRFTPTVLEGHERLLDGPLVIFLTWPIFAVVLVATLARRVVAK